MKYITTFLALLSILEFTIILGLYLRVARLTGEITNQQTQIEDLETDIHIFLNDMEMR